MILVHEIPLQNLFFSFFFLVFLFHFLGEGGGKISNNKVNLVNNKSSLKNFKKKIVSLYKRPVE